MIAAPNIRSGLHERPAAPIGRLGWMVLMLIGVLLVIMLYSVKTRALAARTHLAQLELTNGQNDAAIAMLHAEIAHLENPARLKAISDQHLQLIPLQAENSISFAEAAEVLPDRVIKMRDDDE